MNFRIIILINNSVNYYNNNNDFLLMTSCLRFIFGIVLLKVISSVNIEPQLSFYVFTARRSARIASAVLAMAFPSVCLFICLSVSQMPVLCQNDCT